MPKGVDHDKWKRARQLAKEQGQDKNWKYVMSIYKNLEDEPDDNGNKKSEAGKKRKSMPFPPHEHESLKRALSAGKTQYSHRVSSERGKYKPSDIVRLPWGDEAIILDVKQLDTVDNSPNYKHLTNGEKNLLKKYGKIDFISFVSKKNARDSTDDMKEAATLSVRRRKPTAIRIGVGDDSISMSSTSGSSSAYMHIPETGAPSPFSSGDDMVEKVRSGGEWLDRFKEIRREVERDRAPLKLKIGDYEFAADVMDTDERRRRGFSGRVSEPENYGLVFPSSVFWMRGVPFDLELVGVDEDLAVVSVDHMTAGSTTNIAPAEAAVIVIELPDGSVVKSDVGSKVERVEK